MISTDVTNLLLIGSILVMIIDRSGIVENIERGLSRWLKVPCRIPKPFSCSYCMTFWSGLIYLALTGHFSIPGVAMTLLAAEATGPINEVLSAVKDVLSMIIDLGPRVLNNIFNRKK